ncbi:hypothetical protein LGQ90_09690 [Gramella sp. ASW11-100T]|uniref:Uncharacterized protein n=1 Tax=Christiangramia sediminis TaxID=2881336 RepID=A0A9X1LJN6_9FLAO|nr:hypothetical protein [Christiangramia sediminis]
MEIFTDFVHNYNSSLKGLNIWAKILITLTLFAIFAAVIGAIVNVIALNL